MKRMLAIALCLAALASPLVAQIEFAQAGADHPQIAYRLFSSWVVEHEERAAREKRGATFALCTIGGLALGSATTVWFAGDAISEQASGSPMDRDLKESLSLGLAIGGASILASGAIVASVPVKDYRAIYADVLSESDPEVREAMAVAALKYQADRGKERRITSFVSSLAVPVVTGLVRVGTNLAGGDEWSKDVWPSVQWSCWSIANGVVGLFQKSREERLYERYLTARDALYGASAR